MDGYATKDGIKFIDNYNFQRGVGGNSGYGLIRRLGSYINTPEIEGNEYAPNVYYNIKFDPNVVSQKATQQYVDHFWDNYFNGDGDQFDTIMARNEAEEAAKRAEADKKWLKKQKKTTPQERQRTIDRSQAETRRYVTQQNDATTVQQKPQRSYITAKNAKSTEPTIKLVNNWAVRIGKYTYDTRKKESVQALQRVLNRQFGENLEPDGRYGPATYRAVAKYLQKKKPDFPKVTTSASRKKTDSVHKSSANNPKALLNTLLNFQSIVGKQLSGGNALPDWAR